MSKKEAITGLIGGLLMLALFNAAVAYSLEIKPTEIQTITGVETDGTLDDPRNYNPQTTIDSKSLQPAADHKVYHRAETGRITLQGQL